MENSIPIAITLNPLGDVSPASAAPGVRALTDAIRRGDENAFNRFYAEYSPRIFRLLIVVTGGDEHLSRELHQWVMIKAARKMEVFETEAHLWAWLAQIARNKWRDAWRKRGRESRALDSLQPSGLEHPSDCADRLKEALATLEESERQLVESFYFDDLSQKELARRSARSVKAVQCALARIRRKLKQLI